MGNWKKWFWYGCGTIGIGSIVIFLLGSGWLGFRLFQLEWKPQGKTNLVMQEVALPFENVSDLAKKTGSLPFMAGVVIDVDGDLRDEVFLGGGRDQADGLFAYDDQDGGFVEIGMASAFTKATPDATLGGASIDVDGDGWSDLLVARESGVWLHRNDKGTLGEGEPVLVPFVENSTPLSIAPGDINGDGAVDLYVSGYIKNSLVDGQTNFTPDYGGFSKLLLGTPGADGWRDATADYGLDSQHNRFTAVFADLDNDRDQDLVIAQDTGRVEMYENTGNPPLQPLANPSVYSYPMGIAAGDVTGDGRIDLYFSNVGHTMPAAMLRGNLDKAVGEDAKFNPLYMLFENQGDLAFTDTAKARNIARIGFGWGTVAADLNLDGWEDLLVAQNYAKFGQPAVIHRYAGKILQNYGGTSFKPVEKRIGAGNRLFAISPLVGDFDGDNRPDLVWANLNGPSKAFLNATPEVTPIAVILDDTAASIGAQLVLETDTRTLTRWIIPAQGLSSDQTHKVMFGHARDETPLRLSVTYTDGRVEIADVAAETKTIDLRTPR